ncbi:MAG: hypothetical protein IH790_08820 [Acidobacteria bacterium]|nr:hypothetical protein [Acidobacteriota bacterium]
MGIPQGQTRHLRKTGEVIRRHRGSRQEQLINTLGPIIVGWSRYYAHVVSKAIFTRMYTRVHHQLRRTLLGQPELSSEDVVERLVRDDLQGKPK